MNTIGLIITAVVFGGTGYYMGRRTLDGVKIDFNNAKLEIEHLKDRLSGKAQANNQARTTSVTPKQTSSTS